MKPILLAGLLFLGATTAFAHSKLNTTEPADGAVLAQAPGRIVLSFAKRIRLTKVRMRHGDNAAVDLDLSGQKGFATRIAVPMPRGGSGLYRIEWRGLAADGHTMRGSFEFRVK
ncbi:MAG: copper resistance protein CopC [Rhodospirillaceae bacterium]|nr:copper resistance protein CopC [Rhodospirillaceae bacterium]MYF86067.1 copper resistance protein CopC [Rhodospirillaceae bacterium]MYH36474.1 copper resistance protein CopC [Rhodospirillaceae bacterium]MYK13323.1 copper resistance protein CopC [Rhodospirillaceae bacterium]